MTEFGPKFRKFMGKHKQQLEDLEKYQGEIKALQTEKSQCFKRVSFFGLEGSNLRPLIHKILSQEIV